MEQVKVRKTILTVLVYLVALGASGYGVYWLPLHGHSAFAVPCVIAVGRLLIYPLFYQYEVRRFLST